MLLDLLFHHKQGGSQGDRQRSRFVRRDDALLAFIDEEEKEQFVEAQEQAKQAINRAARRKVVATQPKPVIVDLNAVDKDLITRQQYQKIVEIYLLQLEEEDIELLLTL